MLQHKPALSRTSDNLLKIRFAGSVIIAAILTCFCLAEAQQTAKPAPRVGFIFTSGGPGDPLPWFDAFQQGLRDLGYVDGKNIVIERRYAEGRSDRMSLFVNEFVQQKIDVILGTSNVVIRSAKEATKTTPVVMISSVDPVTAGYAESFAHPGGNITGLAWLLRDISAKRVELLKELLPKLSKVGILWDADGPGPAIAVKEYEAAAQAFKIELRPLAIRGPNPDFVGAFQMTKGTRLDALIVVANPLMAQQAKEVFELTAKYRLPSITEARHYVEAGGLMSYGANVADLYRRAAGYVVEILKGAKPGDLPIKLAEKFEIFVNLKTADKIGVTMPQHLLLQSDKIIKD